MSNTDNKDDDILSIEEPAKLQFVRFDPLIQQTHVQSHVHNNQPNNLFSFFGRIFGIGQSRVVRVNNTSGKKAWIILTPAPIMSLSSIGLDKLGQLSFSTNGEYKCQQSGLSNNTVREFELDNSQMYYTVFFDCDGKWKILFKDRKVNTRKYDINLLERHVEDAIEIELVPVN